MAIARPTPYYGDGRPCDMYRNGVKLAGWKWQDQTGLDLPIDATYNDHMLLTAQGRSNQSGTPSPSAPVPIVSAQGTARVEDQADAQYAELVLPVLRGIPNGAGGWIARDALEIVDGRLVHTQRVGHVALTGAESVPFVSAGIVRFVPAGVTNGVLSTHFRSVSSTSAGDLTCASNASGVYMRYDSVFDSSASAKTWLAAQYNAGTPVTVDYVLATHAVTDLGPDDLPTYYRHTRARMLGDYPPDVMWRARVVDES